MMRPTSDEWRALLPYAHPVVTVVESWLGTTRLSASVPITSAAIAFDDTATVKRRLTLSVPAYTPGRVRWDPAGDPSAPLAAYGQRLHVRSGIGLPNRTVELVDLGWYLITRWKRDDESAQVQVEALDLAQLIVDDRLVRPETPAAGATYAGEFDRLARSTFPFDGAVIDPGLVDRPVGGAPVWERDRDRALDDLCTSWPARWYVGDDGLPHAAPPWPAVSAATVPDVTLTDGAAGTIVGRAREAQRGALYNAVVVEGKTPDDSSAPPYAVREITDQTSPIRVSGPYGRLPRFYASDLITTQAQADSAASALLVTYASNGRAEPVRAVPDPSLQLGDVARVYTRDGDTYTGRVSAITLPLTAEQGAMALTVSFPPMGVI